MKLFFRIFLVAAFTLAGATSASAQTKEFLEAFNLVKHLVELPNSRAYKGIELGHYPGEMLRSMGLKDNNGVLNRLQVIYQVKIPYGNENRSYANATYHRFTSLVHINQKPKLYEQIMCQTTKEQEFSLYKAIRKKNNQPSEFIVLIKNAEKAIVCDVVGYITVQDVLKMLSPDLKNYVKEDTLSISNK